MDQSDPARVESMITAGRLRERKNGAADADAWLPRSASVGGVDVWWIRRPRGPRLTVPTASIALVAAASATVGLLVSIHRRNEDPWPFGHTSPSVPQQFLKYAVVVLVFLGYAVLRSLPSWWRCMRIASADGRRLTTLVAESDWPTAAQVLHRYVMLASAIWGRPPRAARDLATRIGPHLLDRRRMYLYYRNPPPELPDDPTSSFAPEVVTVGTPKLGAVLWLLPLFVLLLYMVDHVINALLVTVVLAGYGTFFALVLLGRVSYVRLAPGVVQRLRFSPFRRRPQVETFGLRDYDVVLDTTTSRLAFGLVSRDRGAVEQSFQLPASPDVVAACMRAALSEAPVPPLPDDQLEG